MESAMSEGSPSRRLSGPVARFREESQILAAMLLDKSEEELLRVTPHYEWRALRLLTRKNFPESWKRFVQRMQPLNEAAHRQQTLPN